MTEQPGTIIEKRGYFRWSDEKRQGDALLLRKVCREYSQFARMERPA